MAVIPLFKCELCCNEHRPGEYWWNNANGGEVTICRDGINGQRKWSHLCPTCRSVICEAVDKAVDSLTPKVQP